MRLKRTPATASKLPISAANGLSFGRLLLAPLVLWTIVVEQYTLSLGIFVIAVVSDVLDGRIARKQNNVTRIGGILDHTADCLFVVCALYALSTHGIFHWALPAIVAAAFLQYVIDSGVLKKKGLVPSQWGRWNGIAYFVLAAIPIVQKGMKFEWISDYHLLIAGWAMVAMTAGSMLERLGLLGKRPSAE